MRPGVLLLAALVTTAAHATPAAAQQTREGSKDVRLVPGFVRQGGVFGDDDPKGTSGFGVSAGVMIRGDASGRTGATFEATLQLTGVRNPHFDETLHSVYTQVGAEIGRRFYVRPSGGVAFQLWSGEFAADPSIGLAFGLAVGFRRPPTERPSFWPELAARISGGHGFAHWMLGLQMPIGWRR